MVVKKVLIDKANRLYQMPPEIFAFVQSEKKRKLLRRPDLIDLGSFNWPDPTISDRSIDPGDLRPASSEHIKTLRQELAAWMYSCHRVKLVPEKEVFVGGSIRGLVNNLVLAFIDFGDIAFVPDLSAPLYRQAVTAFGGEPISYDVLASNDWLPSFDRVQTRLGRVARLLFLNSPHNPTGAVMGERQIADLVWIASRENILVCNDAAYQSLDDRTPCSLLAVNGGKKVGVELYSLAYQFGLPSFPAGFAVGNREIIRGLKAASRLTPSYLPVYFVNMALQAIRQFPSNDLKDMRRNFHRALAESGKLLEQLSLQKCSSDTVPYVWARLEKRSHSVAAARLLYRRHRILVAPGTGFGDSGQGYLRFSLTAGRQAYIDAAARLKRRIKLGGSGDSER